MSGVRVSVRGRRVYVGNGSGSPAPDAPALVFVHGAGMDHTVWALPARHFARKGFRVLAVDLPGHGRSAGPPCASVPDMCGWLLDVLEVCGVGSAAVAGHSMGSLVAWEFARRHPRRCAGLALLGTSAPMPVTPLLLNAARDNHHAAIDMANAWSHSPAGRIGAAANPGTWMLGVGERLLERAAPGVFHADLAACDAYRPDDAYRSDKGGVSCPVLVVAGDADQMTPPKAGIDVAARAPSATVVRLPGCGHSMLSERPNEVLDALVEAFGRFAPGGLL